jgi:hypothetical protein
MMPYYRGAAAAGGSGALPLAGIAGVVHGAARNESYFAQLSQIGGVGPYTWSIISGALPDGLTLDSSTGLISGVVPNTESTGYYSATVKVEDSAGHYRTRSIEIGVGEIITLLHFDGSDLATAFPDEVDATNWTAVGNASLRTAVSKFGSASVYFDGTGDRVTRTKAAFALGSSDFTIDFWFRPESHSGSFARLLQFGPNVTNGGLWLVRYGSSNPFRLLIQTRASGSYSDLFADVGGFTNGQFQHGALSKKGNDWRLFVGGGLVGTVTRAYSITASQISIGSNTTNGESLLGYVDEFRITAGAVRWWNEFTPPAAASDFPVVP